MTAEEFAQQRWTLPEDGRWTELIAGKITQLAPPDVKHGNSVLNLSRRLAEFRQYNPHIPGAACFDQGLIASRKPDFVLVPAISFIPDAGPFDLADEFLTDKCPTLIVEILSTSDRKKLINTKLQAYLSLGVSNIWIVDVTNEHVISVDATGAEKRLESDARLEHADSLPGFTVEVQELFTEPQWWSGQYS